MSHVDRMDASASMVPRIWICAGLLTSVGLVCMLVIGDHPDNRGGTATASMAASGGTGAAGPRRVVMEMDGNGSKKSDEFAVGSGRLAAAWECQATPALGVCFFAASIVGSEILDTEFITMFSGQSGKDTTRLYLEPGTYHVEVDAGNCAWSVRIMELD